MGIIMSKIERFLIVDDQDANLLFFQVLLEELGYSAVYTANHGHDAQIAADRFNVQFVISSWELKGMPGTVFVQRLRSHRKYYNVPFLIYSKEMTDNERALVGELGLPSVIKMPFDRADAKKVIEELIEAENSLTPDEVKFRKMEAAFATNAVEEALKLADHNLVNQSSIAYKVNTLLGEIYMSMGAMKKAEEYLMKSSELEENYLPNKYALAKLYSVSKRHDKAIEILKGLTNTSPLNVKTLLSLSSAFLMSGKKEDAKHMIAQAEDIDPDCRQIGDERAKVSLLEGDIDKTKEYIDQTESGDQLARDFNMMAISMVANGQFEDGIEVYKKAIDLLGGKAKTYLLRYNLGLAFKKQGKLKSAFVEFAKSYIAEPTYEKAYSAIARTHKDMKAKGIKVGPKAIDKIKAARAKAKELASAEVEQQSEKAG
jgi:tetratricopeptide (TPR) repeat protein